MTTELLLAAALWVDELEAQRDSAARDKWAELDVLTLDQGNTSLQAYLDRDAELDTTMIRPLRERLARAQRLLVKRADALLPMESWPAGGSWLARAYALAKSVAGAADMDAVDAELAALRTAG